MPQFIEHPVWFRDDVVRGEEIKEYVGRISTGDDGISIGLLDFPEGWSEPPQRPEFDEYSIVLNGTLYVDTESVGTVAVKPGQGILTPKGERIRYRTPKPGGARYLSICLPAFAPELSHREPEGATMPMTNKPVWTPESRVLFSRRPAVIQGTGANSRQIEEYFGRFIGNSTALSVAKVLSFEGCMSEFRQTNDDQYVFVDRGEVVVNLKSAESWMIGKNQMTVTKRGEWFQYHTPKPGETVYFLICRPARELDRDNYVFFSENEEEIFAG